MEEELRRIIREEVTRAMMDFSFPESRDALHSVMDVKHLSKYIKKSVNWIYQNIHIIPKKRVGGGDNGSYFFMRDEIDEWLRSGKNSMEITIRKVK